jgi:hypothetical protein
MIGVCRNYSMETDTDPTRTARYLVGSKLPLIEFGLAARCGWDLILILGYFVEENRCDVRRLI